MTLAVDLVIVALFGAAIGYCIYRLIWVDVVEEEIEDIPDLEEELRIGQFLFPKVDGPIPEDTPRCFICGVSCAEPPDYELVGTERSWACHEHLDYMLAKEQCDRCTSYVRCWIKTGVDPDNPSNYWPDPRGCQWFEDMGCTE